MANQISTLLKFVVDSFDINPLVNTIEIVDDSIIDKAKENIYPLVSIELLESEVLDPLVEVTLAISVYAQRNISKESDNTKLMAGTNYIDNINECHSIAVDFINTISRLNNDDNIGIASISKISIKSRAERNSLDGVTFEVDLTIQNNCI